MLLGRVVTKLWVLVVLACMFGWTTDAGAIDDYLELYLGVPQEVVAGPEGVFFIPAGDTDAFFYNGYWWVTRQNKWYFSRDYSGRWRMIRRSRVPAPVSHIYVVPNYRDVYERQSGMRIPYAQWVKNGYRVR